VAPVTDADNVEAVKAVEHRLKCTCGCTLDVYTCRTTDFNCTYSPAIHRQVMALVAQGKSGEQILAEFVAQHGEEILMAPPKEGFNLAGYFMPALAVLVAGGLLVLAMRRWTRRAAVVAHAAAVPSAPPSASPEALEALRQELAELEN
jgi:cytochrome c-type biogenesis protein CcmH